jgi:hypothetical protein
MPKVNCPDRGAQAVKVSLRRGYKFYCSECAWNRGIARAALVSLARQSLVVAAPGLILAAVVSVKNPSEKWAAGAILLAFSGLPLFHIVSARLQLRKLNQLSLQPRSQQRSSVAVSSTKPSPAGDSKTITFKDWEFPELAVIRRPRNLKTTWKGRGYWVFALLAVALDTIYGVPATWSKVRIPGVGTISLFSFRRRWCTGISLFLCATEFAKANFWPTENWQQVTSRLNIMDPIHSLFITAFGARMARLSPAAATTLRGPSSKA